MFHVVQRVTIEGIRGSGYHGDIGIDDVELSQEISCPGTVEGTRSFTSDVEEFVSRCCISKY